MSNLLILIISFLALLGSAVNNYQLRGELDQFGLATYLPVQGGTGTSTTPGWNDILVGNGDNSRYDVLTLTGGSNITFSTSTAGTFSISSTGGGGTGSVGTSTTPTISQVPYWTTAGQTPELLGGVATTTLTAGTNVTFDGTPGYLIGGTNLTVNASGGSGGAFAWTPTGYGVSTSTTLGFLNGFLSTASSTVDSTLIVTGGVTGSLTGNADTATALAANGANCSSGNAPLGVDDSGAVEGCFDVWTEAENTSAAYISDITGENIADLADVSVLSNDTVLTREGGNVVSSSTLSEFLIDAKIARDTELHDAVTLAGALDYITISGQELTRNAIDLAADVTGTLPDGNVTDALTITGGTVEWASLNNYPTGCTNQFVRTIGDSLTCATVGAGDVSLANLTATDTTLTFSGTYNGSTARTIGLNLGNANTWTALQTINNASTTNLTVATFLTIPSAANPTLIADQIAINTTAASSSIRFHDGTAERALHDEINTSFSYSTTTATTASTTLSFSGPIRNMTYTKMGCDSIGGTVNLALGDGSATSTYVLSATGPTTVFTTLSSNNAFNKGERRYIDIGDWSASAGITQVSCTLGYRYDAD